MECLACGSWVSDLHRKIKLDADGLQFYPGELSYCRECADELFRGTIRIQRPKLYSHGAGCPLEPNDDASPWQENNIREMEG